MAKTSAHTPLADAPKNPLAHIFGVRHLSPMGSWHLRQLLDQVRPDLVMIEGLSDAGTLVPDITRSDSVPPIAILAYSDSIPVRTLVYPLASYSPEYQALMWAAENNVEAEFIDLPSDVFLALQKSRQPDGLNAEADDEDAGEGDSGDVHESRNENESDGNQGDGNQGDEAESDDPAQNRASDPASGDEASWFSRYSLYQEIAERAGEPDYDTYWERQFEHNSAADSYRLGSFELGHGLRELDPDGGVDLAENLVREAFMRRQILKAIERGVTPEKIVVIVGAFHAPVLTHDQPAMTDAELDSLDRLPSKLTLMPYSYFKLSSQSGYGAGNEAPAYFEMLWKALQHNQLDSLAARYMTRVARNMRKRGTHRSTASIIEGVRLSRTLSALKDGLAPTLRDLQDAAVTLIGNGDRGAVGEALARVEVGTAIGRLPKGVSQTSIQEDFERNLDQLKLTKYRAPVKTDLSLDLRENRRAKNEAAAFLDLHRSSFLHRLALLGISFAKPEASRQESTTWAENWILQWTPESEIELVESVLLGETIELAAGFKFKTELDSCISVDRAAEIVRIASQCAMMRSMELARRKLQELATESSEFNAIAGAAWQLSMIVRFGDVRNYNAAPLVPMIEELFVQGSLALFETANCDNASAMKIAASIDQLNKVRQEHHEIVDETLWYSMLRRLSDADDRNPLLSGYACAVLLEENLISNEDLAREVSRRLSPGVSADLGAGWFEGMASRNRYALLARQTLWSQLADYVSSLDEEQFRRALVFLRRAFGRFSPQEKRAICENLGHLWGVDGGLTSEVISQPLTEEEEQSLEDLNEFDFDDF